MAKRTASAKEVVIEKVKSSRAIAIRRTDSVGASMMPFRMDALEERLAKMARFDNAPKHRSKLATIFFPCESPDKEGIKAAQSGHVVRVESSTMVQRARSRRRQRLKRKLSAEASSPSLDDHLVQRAVSRGNHINSKEVPKPTRLAMKALGAKSSVAPPDLQLSARSRKRWLREQRWKNKIQQATSVKYWSFPDNGVKISEVMELSLLGK